MKYERANADEDQMMVRFLSGLPNSNRAITVSRIRCGQMERVSFQSRSFSVRIRMSHFSPHLDILPAPQRALWKELSEVSREFVLYGETALALHLAHRNSVDFDLFGSRALDPSEIEQRVSFLKGANIIQRDKNTLSAIVDRGGPVKVSFFGVPNLPRLSAAVVATDNGLGVASLLDLAGTKASVVQVRAEAKDYIDIDALITVGKVDLPLALSAAQRLYGSAFNPQITLKALSFFDDGNLRQLPEDMKIRLVTAAREVDLDHLPGIEKFTRQIDQDRLLPLKWLLASITS